MVIFLKQLLFLAQAPWGSRQPWCLGVLCDKPRWGTPRGNCGIVPKDTPPLPSAGWEQEKHPILFILELKKRKNRAQTWFKFSAGKVLIMLPVFLKILEVQTFCFQWRLCCLNEKFRAVVCVCNYKIGLTVFWADFSSIFWGARVPSFWNPRQGELNRRSPAIHFFPSFFWLLPFFPVSPVGCGSTQLNVVQVQVMRKGAIPVPTKIL